MNRSALYALAASAALALSAGAAAAAEPGAAIDARQAAIWRSIDAGVAHNDLSREEANSLRGDFHQIERVEAEFRRRALTVREVTELNRRLGLLESRVRRNLADGERADHDHGWRGLDLRQAEVDRRIDAGVTQGDLTRAEAMRLREDFRGLLNLEREFRRDGLTQAERGELDRRFDVLEAQIRHQRTDDQRR